MSSGTSSAPSSRPALGTPLLDMFYRLVDADAAARQQAATSLVEFLQAAQAAHEARSGNNAGSQCPDLQYSLKRLLRGLASPRDCARQGFGATLAALLSSFPAAVIGLSELHELLLASTKVQGSMKGKEERDFLFGRVFGFMAIERSGRLGAEDDEEAAAVTALMARELLLKLGKRKWFSNFCYEVAASLVRAVPATVFASELLPLVAEATQGSAAEQTPSGLGLALAAQRRIADADDDEGTLRAECAEVWPLASPPLLRRGSLHELATPLLATYATCPTVHGVWRHVMEGMFTGGAGASGGGGGGGGTAAGGSGSSEDDEASMEEGGEVETALLQEFWSTIVEGALLGGNNPSHERKWLVLQLLGAWAQRLRAAQLQVVMSKPVLRLLVNSLDTSRDTRILHGQAKRTLAALVDAAEADGAKRGVAACALLTNGDLHFDDRTRTNTVAVLLEGMDEAALEEHVEFLIGLAITGGDGVEAAAGDIAAGEGAAGEADEGAAEAAAEHAARLLDARRAMALNGLNAAAKSAKLPRTPALVGRVGRFLMLHGFYGHDATTEMEAAAAAAAPKKGGKKTPAKKSRRKGSVDAAEGGGGAGVPVGARFPVPRVPLSAATLRLCRTLFFSLVSDEEDDEKNQKAAFTVPDAHAFWGELAAAGATLREPLSDEAGEQHAAMGATVKKIGALLKSKKGKALPPMARKQLSAFATLFLRVGLRMLDGEAGAEEAVDVLESLQDMYAHTPAAGGEDSEESRSAMLPLMLHLLDQPSSWMRDAVKQLFKTFCNDFTEESMQQLVCTVCGLEADV
jgi:DNA polymerase phi